MRRQRGCGRASEPHLGARGEREAVGGELQGEGGLERRSPGADLDRPRVVRGPGRTRTQRFLVERPDRAARGIAQMTPTGHPAPVSAPERFSSAREGAREQPALGSRGFELKGFQSGPIGGEPIDLAQDLAGHGPLGAARRRAYLETQ